MLPPGQARQTGIAKDWLHPQQNPDAAPCQHLTAMRRQIGRKLERASRFPSQIAQTAMVKLL
jgi:hypothetical protein